MATQEFSFVCSICGKQVDITTCKTDELGKPVHNVCYAAKLAGENELPLGSPAEPSRSPKAA
jgi:hypothetical protein